MDSTRKALYIQDLKHTFKLKNYIFTIIIFLGMMACIIAALVLGDNMKLTTLYLFEMIGYTTIAVISLSLIVGYLGELSLGHAAFMSIGAMFGTLLSNSLPFTSSAPFLSLLLSMIAGALAAGFFGFLIGLPALRLKGDYLAIVTLAFGEIVKTVFMNLPLFGGAKGLTNLHRYNVSYLFIIIFVVAFIMILICKRLVRCNIGKDTMAVRDNEIAAKAMGVNVNFVKVFIFTVAAMMAGVAGSLLGASMDVIKAADFNYTYSINSILIMVIIGGMGNINGSVISAIVVTIIDFELQDYLSGDLAAIKNIIFAALLIAIIMYRNLPSLSNFREKYNVHQLGLKIKKWFYKVFLKKEYVKDPSVHTHYSADWSKVPTKIDMDAKMTGSLTDKDTPTEKGDIK